MTAYSFKRRFVVPIRRGLGETFYPETDGDPHPKCQTIRADRKRHARPGEELQLYCGMRTKGCFLIGRARCTKVTDVILRLDEAIVILGWRAPRPQRRLSTLDEMEAFARADGFQSFSDMRQFWIDEHGPMRRFEGVLIQWEPL